MLWSILLGIIQGIGEFLPISSSAHLILIPYLFGLNLRNSSLAFDVALHFGTLMAVIIVYFKDFLNLIIGAFNKVVRKVDSFNNKIFWSLVVSTIPGAILGVLFDDYVENIFRTNILLISISLGIMGVFIYIGDKWASKHIKIEKDIEDISYKDAIIIGLSQALAIIPGFSRSGVTILTSRLLGYSKEGSTKYTFLLSAPIILGATIMEFSNWEISFNTFIGVFTSFIVGLYSIRFLLSYIKKYDFSIFAIYRLLLAGIVLIKYFYF